MIGNINFASVEYLKMVHQMMMTALPNKTQDRTSISDQSSIITTIASNAIVL